MLSKLSNFLKLDLNYFLSGGLWLTLANLVTIIIGIILSAVLARVWSSEVYGQYIFLISVIGLLNALILPGMNQVLLQAISEKKDGTYLKVIAIVLKWSLLAIIPLSIIAVYFYLQSNLYLSLTFLILSLIFPIYYASSLYGPVFTGKKDFKRLSFYTFLVQLVNLGTTIIFLLSYPSFLLVIISSFLFTTLIQIYVSYVAYKSLNNKNTDQELIKLGYHISYSQSTILGADYFDRFFIPAYLGFSANAIYNFAILIPNQIHTFLKSSITLGQPKIAEHSTKNLRGVIIQKAILLELLILGLVLCYILLAPTIFKVFFPIYLDTAMPLSQLIAVGLLYFPSNLFGLGIIKLRSHKYSYFINITYAISNIVIVLVFVSLWGLTGAAFSRIAIRAIYLILQVGSFIKLTSAKNLSTHH